MAKIAFVTVSAKGAKVIQCKTLPLTSSFSPQYGCVCTAIPAQSFFVRALELPLLSKRDLTTALAFHAQQVLPYPIEQAVLQHSFLGRTEDTMRINLFAVRKEVVAQYSQKHEEGSFSSDILVSTPIALATLSRHLIPPEETALLLHMGESEVTAVLVQDGAIRRHFAFSSTASSSLEIKKILFSLLQAGKECAFSRIILLGFFSEELKLLIEETSGKRVELPHSESIPLPADKWAQYGLAIGIALAGAAGYNFKQKVHFSPLRWMERYHQALWFFCGGVALCFALLAAMAWVRIDQMQQSAKRKMESLLMDQEIQGNRMESIQDYSSLLRLTERKIGRELNQFVLIPNLPSIGKILSWISTHLSKDKATIHELNYELIQAPSSQNPSLHYKLRISIDLSSTLSPASIKSLIENSELRPFLNDVTVIPSDMGTQLLLLLTPSTQESP